MVFFEVFWFKLRVLGQIGRSGKVLGFISSNFGPNPTAGCLLKGNNRGAIIIIIIPDKYLKVPYTGDGFFSSAFLGSCFDQILRF